MRTPRAEWADFCQRLGRRLFGERITILFDGSCGLCRRVVRLLDKVDLLGQLNAINALDTEARSRAGLGHLDLDMLMQEMHVAAAGRTWSGFPACRVIAGRVPWFWPFWPLLYVWPVPPIGTRVYRLVADSRACATGADQ